MIVLSFGATILGGLLALWLLGGMVLRILGVLLALAGGLGVTVQHDTSGILVLVIGALLWLAGQWHYALRHQAYKSPLARHVFSRWAPAWLDPTRDWAIPVARSDAVDAGGGAKMETTSVRETVQRMQCSRR